MYTPPYADVAELLAADARGEVSDELLDDVLWFFMTETDGPYEKPAAFSGPVIDYVASRLMEWEVGNGGFAQAAYNISEWFDAAAKGYEVLGLHQAAARIRQARALMEADPDASAPAAGDTLESVFKSMAESDLAALDDGLDEIGWWAIGARMAYVRAHREAFAGVA